MTMQVNFYASLNLHNSKYNLIVYYIKNTLKYKGDTT
jgi:hypothetical protein